jgi:two-component system, NtrC family, response regulator HupR/HoxA
LADEKNNTGHKVWDGFEDFSVIKRLQEAVSERWSIKLNFTDALGYLRGVEAGKFFAPANPICEVIVRSEMGFQDRKATALKLTASFNVNFEKPRVETCTTGVSVIAVPVVIDNEFVGCAYADGFVVEDNAAAQYETIKNYLQRNVPDSGVDPQELSTLNTKDVSFLTTLIQLVVDNLSESQNTIEVKKQTIGELSTEILGEKHSFKKMIGESPLMKEVYLLLERAKDSKATILVNGDNGTGKELIASSLHYESKRKKAPFVAVNCGAFNENLLESELFGHVKGAFTGASADKKGLFEAAKNGTIFLDEIGETPLSMQVKLLRVLQEGTFMAVGGLKELKTNARVICATNRDLRKMIKDKTFREDLYYRLDVINIKLPSLKERKEDIPLLGAHFLKMHSNGRDMTFSESCMESMQSYSWPGNIRQLENEIQRMCILSDSEILETTDLSDEIQKEVRESGLNTEVKGKLKESIDSLEKDQIQNALDNHDGNKSAAAREMGITRSSLVQKIKKHALAS